MGFFFFFFWYFVNLCDSRKIHHLTREFHVKFHLKNRMKFNVEFTCQVINFSIKYRVVVNKCCEQIVSSHDFSFFPYLQR